MQKTETQTVADLALQASEIRDLKGHPILINDNGDKSLEAYLSAPLRTRDSVKLYSLGSFITYVNDFKKEETRLFGDVDKREIRANIDYHTPDTPSWKGHQATLEIKLSPEWQRWVSKSGQYMGQVDFSEFIEDNLIDVHTPAGADLLEMIRALELKKDVKFKSHINLTNGNHQFTYQEEDSCAGKIDVPSEIVLALSPFSHGEPLGIKARIRYRLKEGVVSFSYIIDRPHKVIETAFQEVVKKVAEATEITPLF